MNYIPPKLIISKTLTGIEQYLKDSNTSFWMFGNNDFTEIPFDSILSLRKSIILGEPGCGKSTLINRIEDNCIENKIICQKFCLTDYEINYNIKIENTDTDLIFCLDALDEVDHFKFYSVVKFIQELQNKYPKAFFFISCRLHYVKANISLIQSVFQEFDFLLVDVFSDEQIKEFIERSIENDDSKDILLEKVFNRDNTSLKSIFKIPRYITEVCQIINLEKIDANNILKWTRADFLDKAVYYKLTREIEKGKSAIPNELEISKRILEKLALIMEIKRTNKITKDEFVSILEDVNSNLNLAFLNGFDMTIFIARVLKQTGQYIEFHNSEFQEYLAAKELMRMKALEQILYDVAINYDFEHIYSNWYDVLRYIVELSPNILLILADFLINTKTELADSHLLDLLKQINTTELEDSIKAKLFEIYYSYFQNHELLVYPYEQSLLSLYTKQNYHLFQKVIEENPRIQYIYRIKNQFHLVSLFIAHSRLSVVETDFWENIFYSYAFNQEDELIQSTAIDALGMIKRGGLLLDLSNSSFTPNGYTTYIRMLSHTVPNEDKSIDLFFEALEIGLDESITSLMYISDSEKFIFMCGILLEEQLFFDNFFYNRDNIYGYYILSNRLRDLWDTDIRIKNIVIELLRRLIPSEKIEYTTYLKDFLEQLLLIIQKKEVSFTFDCIDFFKDDMDIFIDCWILQTIISAGQISKLEEIINSKRKTTYGKDICLKILSEIQSTNNLNPYKEIVHTEGLIVYPELTEDKIVNNNSESKNKLQEDLALMIQNADISTIRGCHYILEQFSKFDKGRQISTLDDNMTLLFQEAVLKILDYIDLDRTRITIQKGIYTVNTNLILAFEKYLSIAIKLGLEEKIKLEYRNKLICYLPIGFNLDESESVLYKLVGEITDEEKKYLFEFISNRDDDYLYFYPSNLFKAIEYYKLSEFVDLVKPFVYGEYEGLPYAEKALSLLSLNFMNTSEQFFWEIFQKDTSYNVSRGSLTDIANQCLIRRFNNKKAIEWRFNYLKHNVFEFDLYDFQGVRGVSQDEIEMDEPTFCNCFINSYRDDYVVYFLELLDYSFIINTERKYLKYSTYLQTMIVSYFRNLSNIFYIKEIRKMAQLHENQHAVQKFYPLLKELELTVVNNPIIIHIHEAIEKYNKIKQNQYLPVNNDLGLFHVIKNALADLGNLIANEGLYKPMGKLGNGSYINENLIQKTLKVALEACLLKQGLRNIDILREVNLLDDKRTDLLVKFGFMGPIYIELKLLHNQEIQNTRQRNEYKSKMKQYLLGTGSKYAFYIIFRVRENNPQTMIDNYRLLLEEYKDLPNTSIQLIDCLNIFNE